MPIHSLPIPQLFQSFALALLMSALGFRRVVYFVSIGYAFSIALMALTIPPLSYQNLNGLSLAQSVLLGVWGLRLGIFLVKREAKPSYHKELAGIEERGAHITGWLRLLIWVGVSLLYVAMFSPVLFQIGQGSSGETGLALGIQLAGLLIMAGGLGVEALADKQKSDFKAASPDLFCNVGIYQTVRCPNYLGEILFWVGNWVMGIPVYTTALHWVISLIGVVCIVLIMMGSTKRLEATQDQRYGGLAAYQSYIHTVPVLFPFVPVYTLKNVRVYLE